MNITLRQLKVFSSVARNLSFTKAADEMHLTQPAVSMQVKQLESQLEVALFEQLGKKIFLTEAGNEVYLYARLIHEKLDEMKAILDGIKGLHYGKLSITVATTANYFAPPLLSTFYQRFPGLNIVLDITNRKAILKQLVNNEVDLVIMGQPPKNMEIDLEAAPFMENELVIIAPANHPLAKRKKIPPKALEAETFLVREPGSGTRYAMERYFKSHELDITTGMEVSSDEAIKQSVQAGLGLGFLSSDAVQTELMLDRLAVLDMEFPPRKRYWHIVHRKGKRLSAFAQAFKNFIIEEAPKILNKDGI